jgi:hypothetical protein
MRLTDFSITSITYIHYKLSLEPLFTSRQNGFCDARLKNKLNLVTFLKHLPADL